MYRQKTLIVPTKWVFMFVENDTKGWPSLQTNRGKYNDTMFGQISIPPLTAAEGWRGLELDLSAGSISFWSNKICLKLDIIWRLIATPIAYI